MVCPREVEDLNSNRQNSPKTSNQLEKKLDQRWLDSLRVFWLKKKNFSRRSRKPPNPCPTLTQWHRSSMR